MAACPTQLERRPLHTPQEDRTALIDPPLGQIEPLVEENLRHRAEADYDFQGRSFADLSRQAREELLTEALRWTRAYRDVDSALFSGGPIFLAGHQPQLFHPGVWLKNFALGGLARQHGAVAVNLLIDSDTVKQTSLKVPGGSVARPYVEDIPFDRPGPGVPYEERRIIDRELFASFGGRVAKQIAPFVSDPLIGKYWPMVQERMRQTDNLGACLAQSRHQLEGDWGLQTLEVPQSRVCDAESFCWFVAHLLARLPQLREIYNQAIREYRRSYRVRSMAHPVPELSADGRWLEAPFWISSPDDSRRRPLYVRHSGHRITIADRHGLEACLELTPDGDAAKAVGQIMELAARGVKIRSRALITTLWARLMLGDLFVHGIGGAKYDRVTDVLIERFFAFRPPAFMVVSATLHLPVQPERGTVEHAQTIGQQLRELVYHPELYIDTTHNVPAGASTEPAELIAAKTRWIKIPQTPQNARTRCRTIRRINQRLQPWVQGRREQLLQLQAETGRALQAQRVLAWRGYGFCLHGEETFRDFLRQILPKNV